MDEADAVARGITHGPNRGGHSLNFDGAGIRQMNPAKNVHQGGFTGAVLSDQGDHFGREHLEIDGIERSDSRKTLRDSLHPKNRRHFAQLRPFSLLMLTMKSST